MEETENKKKETGKSNAGKHLNCCSFPYDIIIDILSRLPVKSLLRFQTVSTQWCSLIRSPTFIKLHFDKSNPCLLVDDSWNKCLYLFSPNVVEEEEDDDPSTLVVEHGLSPRSTTYKAYCNGLLCYYVSYANHNNFWIYNFKVCNLSTKQQITLPKPPFRGFTNLGFGFNPCTSAYTLVVIDSNPSTCYLFTLGIPLWRKIKSKPLEPLEFHHGESLCLNGVLHWNSLPVNVITLFHLKTEKFEVLSYPTNFFNSSKESEFPENISLSEFQGTICLFYVNSQDVLNLWVLKDYNDHLWDFYRFVLPYPLALLPHTIVGNWDIAAVSSPYENDHHRYYLHFYNLHTCVSKKIELIGLPAKANMITIGHYKENMITLTLGETSQ